MGAPTLDDDAHGTRPLCYKQLLIGRKAGAYKPIAVGRGNNTSILKSKGRGR
jgi:hypothetical protein